jgi:hypothetical protein
LEVASTMPTCASAARACALATGQLGLGLLDARGVVRRVDLDEELSLGDLLVVLHVHLEHGPADARRDRDDVGVDLRVVGVLLAARQPRDAAVDGQRQAHDPPRMR